jgi:predicted nucleic acid-binding Zn ribbon protein
MPRDAGAMNPLTNPDAEAAPPPAEPMHGCVRCGARIPIDESMCERCNPLGLKAPAASQAHGTVIVGIIGAVVVMAVVARVLLANVGPFKATVDDVAATAGGLTVTITLANQGSSAGATTCRIDDPTMGGVTPSAVFVESPKVPAGGSVTFAVMVGGLGTEPRPLLADCSS